MSNAPKQYAADVREHYEDLPYPSRDPEKEGENFYATDGLSLDAFSHFGWAGKRDLRHGGRILVAGCGTGDILVFLSEQLRGSSGQIIAVDLSSASISIAKARLAKRGLSDAVTFHHMSILDLPNAGFEKFDVIESSGVLHHLPDPNAGLAALASMLKDDGLMAIMVYGQHGRLSIYLVQELMRRLTDEAMPRATKIEMAREFLNQVPSGHWLTVNNSAFMEDITWPDGSGIYDLFLHSVDRAYTVPQIYEWVSGAGLTLTRFFSSFTDDSLYTPECYASSPLLRASMASKSEPERHAIAELMNGNIGKHYFYAAKENKTPAALADDMIISYGPLQWLFISFLDELIGALAKVKIGEQARVMPRPFAHSPPLSITKAAHTEMLLRLMNGTHTISQIVGEVSHKTGAATNEVAGQLAKLYHELRARQMVFLRHQSIPPYATAKQIMDRFDAVRSGK